MTQAIKEACELIMAVAIRNLQHFGWLQPAGFVFMPHGPPTIIGLDLDKYPMKMWANILRTHAGTVGAVGFATLGDGWWVERKKITEDIRPSEEPDRQEAIYLTVFIGNERWILKTIHKGKECEEPKWEQGFFSSWFPSLSS